MDTEWEFRMWKHLASEKAVLQCEFSTLFRGGLNVATDYGSFGPMFSQHSIL